MSVLLSVKYVDALRGAVDAAEILLQLLDAILFSRSHTAGVKRVGSIQSWLEVAHDQLSVSARCGPRR